MISVTRLNGKRFVLNADLIRTIEENPDTIVTLISGEHLVVRESTREVVAKTIEYARMLRRAIPLDQDLPAGAPAQSPSPSGSETSSASGSAITPIPGADANAGRRAKGA